MKLSKRTEYGLRAAVQLARLWPTSFVQAKDLSKSERLPAKFLESILLALRRGGFLESKVGSGGGYRLSRSPREIAVGELIRRLEGRLTSPETPPPADRTAGEMAIDVVNDRLTHATDDALDHLTLEELLDDVSRRAGSAGGMYYI